MNSRLTLLNNKDNKEVDKGIQNKVYIKGIIVSGRIYDKQNEQNHDILNDTTLLRSDHHEAW